MKSWYLRGLALALCLCVGTVSAQVDVNSTSNSTVSSGAQSSAANQGNAQSITFNSPQQPTRTTQRIESAPSLGLGSFGTSFSTDNCSNTIAGQLSVVGFGASAGKALLEQNCAHLRRGYAFGQVAAFAAANHQQDLAIKAEAMVFYEFCTAGGSDSDTAKACESLALIKGSDGTPTAAAMAATRELQQTQQSAQVAERGGDPAAGISPVRTGYNQSGVTGH